MLTKIEIYKYRRHILFGALALVIFNKYLILIMLMLLFGFLGVLSLKITTFVPHISIETISASSILFGYVYGWKVGFIFGVSVGIIGAAYLSFLKLTTLVNALFMGLCGVWASIFAHFNYPFWLAFFLTYVLRSNIGFMVYSIIKPDFVENIMHSYGDAIFNVLITMQIMQVILKVIIIFK